MQIITLWAENFKEIGVLPLKKKLLFRPLKTQSRPKISPKNVFRRPTVNSNFLSDKSQIFLKFSANKGIICTWEIFFLGSDNFKWFKLALKVSHFLWPDSSLQHCVIRKLWIDESLDTVQPARCTRERGPEVFPHLSSKYYKTETPPAPPRCAMSWLYNFGKICLFL